MNEKSGGTLPHLCSEEILEWILNKQVILSPADKDADQVRGTNKFGLMFVRNKILHLFLVSVLSLTVCSFW